MAGRHLLKFFVKKLNILNKAKKEAKNQNPREKI